MRRISRLAGAVSLFLSLTAALTWPAYGEEINNLASELVDLREQVDSLHNELQDARDSHRNRMQALARQHADLESRIKQQRLHVKQLRHSLKQNRQALNQAGMAADDLKPAIEHGLSGLARLIKTGLPFKREERLAELDAVRQQLASGILPPPKAANRLWAFYEDELRLIRDNGLHRQTIRLGEHEVLADVARLGMVMLFFHTADDRYGFARRADDQWQYHVVDNGNAETQIAGLFDALRKQVRTGYFTLPNALAPREVIQ